MNQHQTTQVPRPRPMDGDFNEADTVPEAAPDPTDSITVELRKFKLIQLFPIIDIPPVNIKGYNIKLQLRFEKINDGKFKGVASVSIDKHATMIMWYCNTQTLQSSHFNQWHPSTQPLDFGYFGCANNDISLIFTFTGLTYTKVVFE